MKIRFIARLAFALLLLPAAALFAQTIEEQQMAGEPVAGPKLPMFRLNVEGGYSYRTAKAVDSYYEQLKSGYNVASNMSIFLGQQYGLCFHYSRSMAKASEGLIEDNVAVSLYSAGLAERRYINGNVIFVGDMVVGMVTYEDEGRAGAFSGTIKGSTFGLTGLLGFDFMISPSVAVGFDVSYMLGHLSQVTLNGVTQDVDEGLNRFDFNGGIKYYW